MTQKREYYISEPENAANASIIWLHGLGADGKDFIGVVDQLGLPKDHGVRFIFPSAPFMSITINHGMTMRAWYDIFDLNMLEREDAAGVENSRLQIEEYIANEIEYGIPSERIFLAGFSQGGAMALYTGLKYKQPLCGVICLSAYLPLAKNFADQGFGNHDMPIFMAHGIFDPVVPYQLGLSTKQILEEHKYAVDWNSYPMQHTVCLEELAAIGAFMRRCLS